MSSGLATPSSTSLIASMMKACSTRLTAKPTTSLTRIGVLPAPRHPLVDDCAEPLHRRRQSVVGGVAEQHVVPGQGIDQRDLRPHQAGADDADLLAAHRCNSLARPTITPRRIRRVPASSISSA